MKTTYINQISEISKFYTEIDTNRQNTIANLEILIRQISQDEDLSWILLFPDEPEIFYTTTDSALNTIINHIKVTSSNGQIWLRMMNYYYNIGVWIELSDLDDENLGRLVCYLTNKLK